MPQGLYRYRCPFCDWPAPRLASLDTQLESRGKNHTFPCGNCGRLLQPSVPRPWIRLVVVALLPVVAFWLALLFGSGRLYIYVLFAAALWIFAAAVLMPYFTRLQAAERPEA